MLFFKFDELKERKSDQPDVDIGHRATLRHSISLNVRSSFCSFCACSCLRYPKGEKWLPGVQGFFWT